MASTVKDFEDIIKKSNTTIKTADTELRYLNDQKRVLSSSRSLTPAQTAKLKELNKKIKELEDSKLKAKIELDNANRILPSLRKIIETDKSLEEEYALYDRSISTGGKPTKDRINKLLADRDRLAKTLLGYAPKAPKAPSSFTSATTTTKAVKETTTKAVGKTTVSTSQISGADGGTTKGPAGNETTAGGTSTTKTPKTFEQIISATEYWYNLPDYIFDQDPVLKDILTQAVNEDWDNDKFLSVVQNKSTWWNKNAGPIRERIVELAKYNDLKSRGIDPSNTAYGLFLKSATSGVKNRASQLFGKTLDDATAQKVAEQIWNGYLDDDQNAIDKLLLPYLGKVTSIIGGKSVQTYGGEALKNYQMLQAIAKENGLTLRDVLPNVSTITTEGDLESAVLQKISAGEIDVNTVAQAARSLAAQGQPKYVKDLLNQGYDLSQIFAPYRGIMASELEINPDEITLNDPILRSAITDKGEVNIYDFKKALRKDSRWQYTESARSEVGNAVSSILKDFGFQG